MEAKQQQADPNRSSRYSLPRLTFQSSSGEPFREAADIHRD